MRAAMSSWLATPVAAADAGSEINAAGEGAIGEPDTIGRTAESFCARRDLDDRGSLRTAEDQEGDAVQAHQPGTGPPFYKIGKHNRWKRSEVLAWFDSHSR